MLAAFAYVARGSTLLAEEIATAGRVRVTALEQEPAARAFALKEALRARFAPGEGRAFPDRRIFSVRPRPQEPDLFDATIYDYRVEKAFNLVLALPTSMSTGPR